MRSISEINRKVNPLGVENGKYCFYSKNTKNLCAISPTDIIKEPILFSLIGDSLLAKYFAIEVENKETKLKEFKGIDYKGAGKYLMTQCHNLGVFKTELMRGLGVWEDDKRIVVNTGVGLVVNGVEIEYDDFQKDSEYTYDQPGKKFIDIGESCTQQDIDTIWTIINGFKWAKEQDPYLLLGSLVQAIIGSAFEWRAHVWINGSQGSGKSYLQFKFIRPLLGKFCLGVIGGTSMAGITSKLGFNAYAISYDEAEVRTATDNRKLADVIGLARASSTRDGIMIKGSASGKAVEYRCQSTFIMSSIAPFLKQESDIARFAILELLKPKGSLEHKDKFAREVTANCLKIDSDFSKRWVNYCISLIPKVEKIRAELDQIMAKNEIDSRACDQYGQLIACASAVVGDIDFSIFNETLEETKDNDAEAEPLRVFSRLMGSEVRIPSKFGGEHCTILEALKILYKLQDKTFAPTVDNDIGKYDVDKLFNFLCTYGIKLEDGILYIANKGDKLETLIGKPNWNSLFCLISDFERGKTSISFGARHYKSRYVFAPIEAIVNTDYPGF